MADKTEDIKKQAQESAVVIEDALRSISSQIGDIFKQALDEGADVSKTMARDVQSSLNSLSKVSKGLATSFEKASQGAFNIKDLTKEIQERTAKISSIESQIEIARRNGVKDTKALESELQKVKSTNAEYVKELNKASDLSKNINKSIGLTGAALKGIGAAASKIGFSGIGDVMEEAKQAAIEKAKALGVSETKSLGLVGKIRTMGSAFKVVGKAIISNLTDPLVLAGMLIKGFKSAFNFFAKAYKEGEEAAKRISEENVGMARSLGISQRAASKLAGSVAGMGPTTAASKSSIEGIYKAMGSTEKLSGNTLKVFVKLNTMAGMSAESLAKFQKFAKKSGEDAGTLVSEMAKTAGAAIKNNKLAMTQRDLLDETANQSAYVKLQFAGQGPALVNAVAQSKALGLNMKSARDMASSLLNFEDSIAAEMEAELLTGKQLNLEEARALALKGDNVGAAKLIAEQVGGAAEFMSMNVIQQEALAKAAGMGVDEMSNMLSGQQDMKAEGDDLVKNQEDGIKAMTSAVSLREAAENRARAAAEANIPVYKELSGVVHQLQDTFTKIRGIVMGFLGENVLKPMTKFLESKEGKEFLKKLPEYVKNALDKMKELVTTIGTFLKDTDSKYPWIKKLLAGAAGAGILLKVTGLDKTILKGAKTLFSGIKGDTSAVKSDLGIELGTKSNPMQVENVDSMNVGDMIGTKGKASILKQFKTLLKDPKLMFRALRMKGSGLGRVFGNVMGKLGKLKMPNLTAIFSKMKMPNLTSIFSKIKIPSGAASGLLKTVGGKILAPLEIAMGAITGVSQVAGKTKEEKKAAGIKEDMGGVEAGVIGALTGNANKGSSLSKYVGIEKGGAGDEALGIAASGARGAMVGAAIGSVVPVVGTAIGAAVGGIVGTVSEGFKVFSDPNSKLRQGVTSFVSSTSETLSGWASSAGSTISGWASKAGEKISGWASSAGSSISGWVSKAGGKLKSMASSVGEGIKSAGGKIANFFGFATGGIAPGGFQAFADGGIVTKPTFGLVGEGSMNEAIIPLPDGKSVPVKIQGGGSNNSSNAQVVTLLKELITVVKNGGDVVLDGQKVGTAMAAGSYRMQ